MDVVTPAVPHTAERADAQGRAARPQWLVERSVAPAAPRDVHTAFDHHHSLCAHTICAQYPAERAGLDPSPARRISFDRSATSPFASALREARWAGPSRQRKLCANLPPHPAPHPAVAPHPREPGAPQIGPEPCEGPPAEPTEREVHAPGVHGVHLQSRVREGVWRREGIRVGRGHEWRLC